MSKGEDLCPDHQAAQTVALGDLETRRELDTYEYFGPSPEAGPDLSGLRLGSGATRYGERALRGVLDDVRASGGRNNGLTRAGFRVGQLIKEGHVAYADGVSFCERLGQEMKLPEREVKYVLHRNSHAKGAIQRGMEGD